MYYRLKEGEYEKIKIMYPDFNIGKFAERVGIKRCFMSLILNRNRTCSKMTAYCFAKALNSKLEINDLFDILDKPIY